MKRIRFWGTRGSLPVALTAPVVREKIIAALRGASGRTFGSNADIERYVDGLAFAEVGTYGGHTSCVEIETGQPEYVICDLGRGARPFGQAALARHGPQSPQTYHVFLSHALGSHHGAAVLRARVHSRQPRAHLRQPSVARVGAQAAAG
jgi:hypothetical protein